jgi:hypothetical protein
VIKQGSFLAKGTARGNGDAALTGDPLVTFKGFSGQAQKLFGVTWLEKRRTADAFITITPVSISTVAGIGLGIIN